MHMRESSSEQDRVRETAMDGHRDGSASSGSGTRRQLPRAPCVAALLLLHSKLCVWIAVAEEVQRSM